MRIEAKEGFTFKRIHDGFIMGENNLFRNRLFHR